MKNRKSILLVVLLLAVGFAAISTTLYINGSTKINPNQEDFNVYYSDAYVNGTQDKSVIEDNTHIVFETELSTLGEKYVLDYEVTNGSKNYDAELVMECTGDNEYLTVTNEFDDETILKAKDSREGKLTLELTKSNAGEDVEVTIACIISANAVERDSLGENENIKPITYEIGEEIKIGEEVFNVVSQTDETVTMLAQYNLGTDYKQTMNENKVSFSNSNGWEYKIKPSEAEIDRYEGNVKDYIKNYVAYLNEVTESDFVKGDLISLSQLGTLDCKYPTNYGDVEDSNLKTCANSKYKEWLVNDQIWWTKSIYPEANNTVWYVYKSGALHGAKYNDVRGIRPIITIPKSTIVSYQKNMKQKIYEVGYEFTISNEKFNVISSIDETVTLLAQKNLSTSYKQSGTANIVLFANKKGWEYTPGPKEIDIFTWTDEPKNYVNRYVTYLIEQTGDTGLTGNLITLNELKSLDCDIIDNYSDTTSGTCVNSKYKKWLINDQTWWTRSANANQASGVWIVQKDGTIYGIDDALSHHGGIRPTITMTKEAYEDLVL